MVKSEIIIDHCDSLVLRSGQRVQSSLVVFNQSIRATAISASGSWFDHSLVGTILQMATFIAKSVVVQDVARGPCAQIARGLVALIQVLWQVGGLALLQ